MERVVVGVGVKSSHSLIAKVIRIKGYDLNLQRILTDTMPS